MVLWCLPLLIVAWSVTAILWDPSVPPWQPLASHGLVPVVLPGLLLLAAWLSSRLASRASLLGASHIAVGVVGTCCILALAIPPLVTTFNPALTTKPTVGRYSSGISKLVSRIELRGVGASPTERGSVAAAASLCAAIGPSASVLFTDPATAASLAPAVRSLCGRPRRVTAVRHHIHQTARPDGNGCRTDPVTSRSSSAPPELPWLSRCQVPPRVFPQHNRRRPGPRRPARRKLAGQVHPVAVRAARLWQVGAERLRLHSRHFGNRFASVARSP